MRTRYYNPSAGRFISEDSARDGLNWYVYANNNPIRYIDPTGHWAVDGSDERFRVSNPIVYAAIADLSATWDNLNNLLNQTLDTRIDIREMMKETHELANIVRAIGDGVKVGKPWFINDNLNNVERVLYASDSESAQEIIWAGASARMLTEDLYGTGYATNDNSDAFRHSYWNGAAVMLQGLEFTNNWTNAHEYGISGNFILESINATFMDLFNNRIGMQQGAILGLGGNEVGLERAIITIIDSGGLLRIVNGVLAGTDSTGRR